MLARLRSWWQYTRKHRVAAIIIAFILVMVLIFAGYWSDWTGFKGKTLWDWLNLVGVLAIPAVVGLGAAWYTAQQGKVSDRENTDNQREAALQAYINSMSELLLHEKMRQSAEDDEVRTIARVRTLTVLPRLDLARKMSVLQFLHESGLIDKDKKIVDLQGVNLHKTHLNFIQLRKADLSGAILGESFLFNINLVEAKLCGSNLIEADLTDADLRSANLIGADLRKADLSNTNLSGAILIGAKVTTEQLDKAVSLQGATMPDGTKHA